MKFQDAFTICRGVEAQGHDFIKPLLGKLLKEWMPTHMAPKWYQRQNGDYVGTTAKGGQFVTIELKTEQRTTGNLFLETWSNLRFGGSQPGWLHTLQAEWLWYSFLDEKAVYMMRHQTLWEWSMKHGNINRYRQRMAISDQRNETYGHLVPVEDLKQARVISSVWKKTDLDFQKVWQVGTNLARPA